jgi:hypothetical protein
MRLHKILLHSPARVLALFAAVLLASLSVACQRASVHQALKQTVRPAQGAPVVLAVYEPWFGDSDHMDVGYSSQDRAVLARQVDEAQDLGISAFVVDWYGQRKPFLDGAYARLQQTAAQKGFKVALMYDEPEDSSDPTADAISALDYAYQQYVGPQAPERQAYLTYQGRPVLFIWPRQRNTDWKRVGEHLQSWQSPPLILMEDGEDRWAAQADGFYAWVKPGPLGWTRDGSNWGRDYLEGFYQKMKEKYPDKIAVGAAWPGFDDRRASWSQDRFMDTRCGKTFADSLRLFRRYYPSSDPLPFLLVITWNDYEEGTAIERGVGCGGVRQNQTATQRSGGSGAR